MRPWLVILIEEASAREMLKAFLPKILPLDDIHVQYLTF